MTDNRIEVVYHQRRPLPNISFSLETYFDTVRQHLSDNAFHVRVHQSPHASRGIRGRVRNMRASRARRGQINHITGDGLYLGIGLPGRRTVLTVPDLAYVMNPSVLRRAMIELLWYRLPVRRAAIVTVISEFTRSRLLDLLPEARDKVRVIYACPSTRFAPDARPFRAERPVLLQVGTSPNKNVERVAHALEGMDCQLHVLGALNAEHAAALRRARIDYRNSVNLSTDELVRSYREADAVVFCSTYEGFGLPIVEAQLVGRPVITSTVASMPEIAGNAACLVNPFDVRSIRAGIQRVIADNAYRTQLVADGFRNAGRFAPKRIADEFADVYRSLASSLPPGVN